MAIPVGATLAVFITPDAKLVNLTIKYLSGGTLELLSCGYTEPVLGLKIGTTQTPAALASLSGSGYLMGGSEVLSFSGHPSFYLSSTGATSIVCAIYAKGQGG